MRFLLPGLALWQSYIENKTNNVMTTTQPTLLDKLKSFSWAIVLFLMIVVTIQTCGNSKKISAMQSQIDSLPTKKEVSTEIKIEGLQTSKRMLYDNNAIIRTAVRPDDKMKEYDDQIEKLQSTGGDK